MANKKGEVLKALLTEGWELMDVLYPRNHGAGTSYYVQKGLDLQGRKAILLKKDTEMIVISEGI